MTLSKKVMFNRKIYILGCSTVVDAICRIKIELSDWLTSKIITINV